MAKIDTEYHNLLDKILQEGYTYEDPNRKGINRIEIPSYKFRHEFKDGFPAVTTKKLHYKNVVTELIWFLRGDTNIKYLVDNGCNIWNKDAYNYYLKKCKENKIIPVNNNDFIKFTEQGNVKDYFDKYKFGDLGKVYGHYWRNFDGFDQIQDIIDKMINTPMSSEIIVTARNPNDKDNQALPCCHYGFQIVMIPLSQKERIELFDEKRIDPKTGFPYDQLNPWFQAQHKLLLEFDRNLDDDNIPRYGFELHWDQRSVDTYLGLPYNIASYATLSLILEKITGHKALAIQGDLKKVHLYDNSLDAVKEQLSRDVNKYGECDLLFKDEFHYITDKELVGNVSLNKIISEMKPDWFVLENYESYPAINVEMLERDE